MARAQRLRANPGGRSSVDAKGDDFPSVAPGEGVRVLFIEDDVAISEMYRTRLELAGYTVVVAGDGETGLELADKHPDAIVFLDIGLPSIDGLTVLASLRANHKTRNTAVIILSNYGQGEQVERSLRLGVVDYLVKAETTPSMLAQGLDEWINGDRRPSDQYLGRFISTEPEAATMSEA